MIRKIGKTVATIIGGIIPAFSLMLVMSSIAWAISASSPIKLENGTISLDGTVPVANGGTNLATYSGADRVIVSSGATTLVASQLPSSCSASDKALAYNTSGQAFTCNDIPSDTNTQLLTFQSESKINANVSGSVFPFIGAGGSTSLTVGDVQTVSRAAATYSNLACTISGDPGANLTITLVYGTCGTLGSTSTTQTVTFVNGNGTSTIQKDTDSTQAVDADKCIALKATSDGNPAAVFVNCNIEKS
jgi:hypothetical protein